MTIVRFNLSFLYGGPVQPTAKDDSLCIFGRIFRQLRPEYGR
jgi:hypothetical protein